MNLLHNLMNLLPKLFIEEFCGICGTGVLRKEDVVEYPGCTVNGWLIENVCKECNKNYGDKEFDFKFSNLESIESLCDSVSNKIMESIDIKKAARYGKFSTFINFIKFVKYCALIHVNRTKSFLPKGVTIEQVTQIMTDVMSNLRIPNTLNNRCYVANNVSEEFRREYLMSNKKES